MGGWKNLHDEKVLLAHGAGGLKTQRLIRDVFQQYLGNVYLQQELDAAIVKNHAQKIAVTTDSFVVKPIFFPGGDIGKISVCGTVNDLAVMGAKPLYLTLGVIIEEGLPIKTLKQVVSSLGETAREAGVQIITGDTKVVEHGAGDKIYINTTGIGALAYNIDLRPQKMVPGDKIIVSGPVGNHGVSILAARERLEFNPPVLSDCTYLNYLTEKILATGAHIKCMRDPTRGGLATTLNELASQGNLGIRIYEERIPIDSQVQGVSSMLGLDPLYLANEGKVIVIVSSKDAELVLKEIRKFPIGENANIIGEVTESHPSKVIMETGLGTLRVLNVLESDPLPRIC